MSGKGSQRRPQLVADTVVADNWERTFGKGDEKRCSECNGLLPDYAHYIPRPAGGSIERRYVCDPCRLNSVAVS